MIPSLTDVRPGDGRSAASVAGGSATDAALTPTPAGSFGETLAAVAHGMRDALKTGEATAISGLSGDAGIQDVVNAMMDAEQQLRAAIAVRDRVVAAYQEVSRMQI